MTWSTNVTRNPSKNASLVFVVYKTSQTTGFGRDVATTFLVFYSTLKSMCLDQAQRAHDIKMTSYQRQCDVMTSHRRRYDVILTSCARWEDTAIPLFTIRKTRPCNEYPPPPKPYFYKVKLGFAGVYLFFLFLVQNINCGYSLELPH